MQPKYFLNDTEHHVTPIFRRESICLDIDGRAQDVRVTWYDSHHGNIVVAGKPREFYAAQDNNRLYIHINGKTWDISIADEFSRGGADTDNNGHIYAPMPGVVVEVSVSEGDKVSEGDSIMLIESMKLQTEIKATISGTIVSIGSEAGASFNKGAVLVNITAAEEE